MMSIFVYVLGTVSKREYSKEKAEYKQKAKLNEFDKKIDQIIHKKNSQHPLNLWYY